LFDQPLVNTRMHADHRPASMISSRDSLVSDPRPRK
jgi:hypothetical protein